MISRPAIISGGAAPSSKGGRRALGGRQPEVSDGVLTCQACGAINEHYTIQCPQKATHLRGDGLECMRRYREQGTVCEICKMPGHEMKHHLMASRDYGANQTKSMFPISRINSGKMPEPEEASNPTKDQIKGSKRGKTSHPAGVLINLLRRPKFQQDMKRRAHQAQSVGMQFIRESASTTTPRTSVKI